MGDSQARFSGVGGAEDEHSRQREKGLRKERFRVLRKLKEDQFIMKREAETERER